MIGLAGCRGAATIVNAIATGKGAAFGISLETDASVELSEGDGPIRLSESSEGSGLAEGCVRSVMTKSGFLVQCHGTVRIRSEIPISRGLKSSSAVSNAIVLAATRALDRQMLDRDIVLTGIEESMKAGVTITGAFDDACACYYGGAVLTNNRTFEILRQSPMDEDLELVIHVPERRIEKSAVKHLDFSKIQKKVEKAFDLAMEGQFLKAMELNSRAYSKVLDVSEEIADLARKNGALAAGISGTGPATVAVCERGGAGPLAARLREEEGTVLVARMNHTPAREVVPRLL
jgi:shikimate kinase